MAYEDEELTMEGRSLKEIRENLYKKYGQNFQIKDRRTEFRPCGLFHLSTKEVQVVKYVVNHLDMYDRDSSYSENRERVESYSRPAASPYRKLSEESVADELKKNRDAILRNQNNILVNSQLQKMNSTIEELNKTMQTMKKGMEIAASEKPESIKKIEEILQQNEFTFSYIQMIEDKIRAEFSLEQLEDFKLVERQVVDWIGETILIEPQKVHRPPQVIIIVGPTGVGKTTTIAKLASNKISNKISNEKL